MATTKITKILFRRGSDYDRAPTILDEGEPGWCTDTCRLYVGDGRLEGGFPVVNIRTPDNAPVHPYNNDFKFEAINDTTGTSQPASQSVLTLNHQGLSASIAESWSDTRYIKHSFPDSTQIIDSTIQVNDGLVVGSSAQLMSHARVGETLTVSGSISGKADATIQGKLTTQRLAVNNDTSIAGNLVVVGVLSGSAIDADTVTSNTPIDISSGGTGDDGTLVNSWNTAYSWGNHGDADYITRTEAPMLANQVTEMYSTWGDHRDGGYALAADTVNVLEDARSADNDLSGSIDFNVGAGNSDTGNILESQSRSILRRLNTKNSLKIGDIQAQSTVILGTGLALDNITDQSSTFDDNMVHITAPQAVKIHTFTDGNVNGANQQTLEFQNGELSVPGAISAPTKNFDIEHPTKPGKRLIHGCLEGPEHGVYVRGRSSSKTVDLPEYWSELIDENSITVQLTPVGKQNCMWVVDTSATQIKIDSESEGEFFYTVQATRKDVDQLQTEKDV